MKKEQNSFNITNLQICKIKKKFIKQTKFLIKIQYDQPSNPYFINKCLYTKKTKL
jgi:chaperonin GroEL (HSP60 family)